MKFCQNILQVSIYSKITFLKRKTTILFIKANHLAYIKPRWYGSRISADCQQKLLLRRHDTSGRFLLVTSLEKQKRENGTQMIETAK